jgi:hypothetical protein
MDTPLAEAIVDAQCAVLGLTLDPAWRPGVVRYLQLAAGMADLVMQQPLTPADEPATHFVPVAPPEPGR